MLRRVWLVFAQATTVGMALLFVVSTLKPQWISRESATNRTVAGSAAPAPSPVAGTSIRQIPADEPVTRANALGSYADAAMRAMPSVVNVYTAKQITRGGADDSIERQFFGESANTEPQSVARLGSGVIVTADGYVLTNNHVVQAADEIAVALSDGRRVDARLVGSDPETDLAVLKIDLPDLPVMIFGRSETLKVGDVVLAIGNPFNVGQTVTMGIVSALGRTNLGINTFENFIQTDAAINEGNSGGALVDSNGHLVGINTAIFSRTGGSIGIGFAIPTSIVTQVMDQIVQNGRVKRGYFGIELYDITPELVDALRLKRKEGVVVRGVLRNGPAGNGGMEPGDVIVSINGVNVSERRAMLNQIAQLEPGAMASVHVLRDAKDMNLKIRVGERPPPATR
ncbi:MAG TPA: trypsin-like peptidase domain-containing protein [Burkholderiaceae bacterium]|nr:trypsin-like peptidase domain-containing protein [Burkholderiaceae bacterium]